MCRSMRLYDGSEEAVAWLVRWLGGGCRLACTTARRRLLLGLYGGSEEAVAWLGVALAFTRGTVNQL
jgi:hypothetical protein